MVRIRGEGEGEGEGEGYEGEHTLAVRYKTAWTAIGLWVWGKGWFGGVARTPTGRLEPTVYRVRQTGRRTGTCVLGTFNWHDNGVPGSWAARDQKMPCWR